MIKVRYAADVAALVLFQKRAMTVLRLAPRYKRYVENCYGCVLCLRLRRAKLAPQPSAVTVPGD